MRQLLVEYVRATEINLATLGELMFLKSSSKSRIKRQRDICFNILKLCQENESEIPWSGYAGLSVDHHTCSRGKELRDTGLDLDGWVKATLG